MSGSRRGRSLAEVMAPIEDDPAGSDTPPNAVTPVPGEALDPPAAGRGEPEAQPLEAAGGQAVARLLRQPRQSQNHAREHVHHDLLVHRRDLAAAPRPAPEDEVAAEETG